MISKNTLVDPGRPSIFCSTVMIKACPVLKHFVSELTAKMRKMEETTKIKRRKKKKN